MTQIPAIGQIAQISQGGWDGTGERISIEDTRAIIDAILDGSADTSEKQSLPVFQLEVPMSLAGVNDGILDPRKTYADPDEWEQRARSLAGLFIDNFSKFTDTDEGRKLVAAGPQLDYANLRVPKGAKRHQKGLCHARRLPLRRQRRYRRQRLGI